MISLLGLLFSSINEPFETIQASEQQCDSYTCSLFAFANIRKILTVRGLPHDELLDTEFEDIRTTQKKILDYLADVAWDLVFYLNPELQAAIQTLPQDERGGALHILLRSYLEPLLLQELHEKFDSMDELAEEIVPLMIYDSEPSKDKYLLQVIPMDSIKSTLLKKLDSLGRKLEPSTAVATAEVLETTNQPGGPLLSI